MVPCTLGRVRTFCCNDRPVRLDHSNAPFVGDRYLQIGDWRLGAIDDNHASMSHKDGKTAQIYRNDGTLHGTSGRTDWGCYGWSGKCGTAGPTCLPGKAINVFPIAAESTNC